MERVTFIPDQRGTLVVHLDGKLVEIAILLPTDYVPGTYVSSIDDRVKSARYASVDNAKRRIVKALTDKKE